MIYSEIIYSMMQYNYTLCSNGLGSITITHYYYPLPSPITITHYRYPLQLPQPHLWCNYSLECICTYCESIIVHWISIFYGFSGFGKHKIGFLTKRKNPNQFVWWSFLNQLIQISSTHSYFFTKPWKLLPTNKSTFTVYNVPWF